MKPNDQNNKDNFRNYFI